MKMKRSKKVKKRSNKKRPMSQNQGLKRLAELHQLSKRKSQRKRLQNKFQKFKVNSH
jgi:hypothetical protein